MPPRKVFRKLSRISQIKRKQRSSISWLAAGESARLSSCSGRFRAGFSNAAAGWHPPCTSSCRCGTRPIALRGEPSGSVAWHCRTRWRTFRTIDTFHPECQFWPLHNAKTILQQKQNVSFRRLSICLSFFVCVLVITSEWSCFATSFWWCRDGVSCARRGSARFWTGPRKCGTFQVQNNGSRCSGVWPCTSCSRSLSRRGTWLGRHPAEQRQAREELLLQNKILEKVTRSKFE